MITVRIQMKGQKPSYIEVASKQEAHKIAKGLAKGCKVKIMETGKPELPNRSLRSHSSMLWGHDGKAQYMGKRKSK